MHWFNLIKNINLINVKKTKVNLHLNVNDAEETENVMFSIERRELNPAYNLAKLVGLGVKIIGPAEVVECKGWSNLTEESVGKLELLVPSKHGGYYPAKLSLIKFGEIHESRDNGPWFAVQQEMGRSDKNSFRTKDGVVLNLQELKSFVDGNKYILESKKVS